MSTFEIINEEYIESILEASLNTSKSEAIAIIDKSRSMTGLSAKEASVLLQTNDPEVLEYMYKTSKEIKEHIYGNRIVIFAPLYTSNECTNNCLYCGFRSLNKDLERKTLVNDEIMSEVRLLEKMGHKRILLVCGEDKRITDIDHITSAMDLIYNNSDIRRINVNAAPMEVEEFKKLKAAGVGTFQIFQETYHRDTYKKMHISGSKRDYDYRLTAVERALEAGIDDYGIGVLLGLYDYKFDVLATLVHAEYMDTKYGVGPHTISIPRLRPAHGSGLDKVPYELTDEELKKVVCIYRLAVPYTGIILSTRENAYLRDELLELGVSQMSAASKTGPGGYAHDKQRKDQFETSDERSLDEILNTIIDQDHLPSFCTACYRSNRTGEAFMNLAKEADISKFCQPNAIITLKEKLMGTTDTELISKGNIIIEKELMKITEKPIKDEVLSRLKRIENGEKDLFM